MINIRIVLSKFKTEKTMWDFAGSFFSISIYIYESERYKMFT